MPGSAVPSQQKTCVRCGRDCSDRPRVRDKHGRYCCKECVDSLRSTRAGGPASSEEGIIAIDDADLSDRHRAPCPKCGHALKVGEPACPGCGFDPTNVPLNTEEARRVLGEFDADPDATPTTQRKPDKKKPKGPICQHCGYSLRGVPAQEDNTLKCPECGKITKPLSRTDYDIETSRETVRWAWLKPFIMLGGGLVGSCLVWFLHAFVNPGAAGALFGFVATGKASLTAGFMNVAIGLVGFTAAVIVAYLITVFCGLLWTGINSPLGLMALQIAGIMACSMLFVTVVGTIPLPIPPLIIEAFGGMMYAYLLA